jgi:excisionase family DNA binding protein
MSEPRKPIRSPPAAYRVAALAERWQCSSGHIYGLIRDGKLNAFKVGKLLRVKAEEVERIEAQWR